MRWNIFDDSRLAFNGSNGAISTFGRVGLVGTRQRWKFVTLGRTRHQNFPQLTKTITTHRLTMDWLSSLREFLTLLYNSYLYIYIIYRDVRNF